VPNFFNIKEKYLILVVKAEMNSTSPVSNEKKRKKK